MNKIKLHKKIKKGIIKLCIHKKFPEIHYEKFLKNKFSEM